MSSDSVDACCDSFGNTDSDDGAKWNGDSDELILMMFTRMIITMVMVMMTFVLIMNVQNSRNYFFFPRELNYYVVSSIQNLYFI